MSFCRIIFCVLVIVCCTETLTNVEVDSLDLDRTTIDVVPPKIKRGETAVLRCNYDVVKEQLYAVKWYKDRNEFYRYVPGEEPKIRVFLLFSDHLNVNTHLSNEYLLVLENMDNSHSGNYTCVVYMDAPTFSIFSASKYISVEDAPTDENVKIDIKPLVVKKGANAVLRCNYDLEGKPLYSVKWYKDNREFYRYVPNDVPKTKVFPLFPDFVINLELSNDKEVALENVDVKMAGDYVCEVVSDAPTFTSLIASTFMVVVDETENKIN